MVMDPLTRRNQADKIRRRYNLSPEQHADLQAQSGGKCTACGLFRELVVDHDHRTDDVRGMLCQQCNAAIGMANDSPEVLRKLAAYLERPPAILRADLKGEAKPYGWFQKTKSHCVHGHEFSPDNTIVDDRGYRRCRACRVSSWRARNTQLSVAAKNRGMRVKDVRARDLVEV
jgi:Recombination endonuclease VII